MENGSINGEQILPSLSVDFEEEIIAKIEKEELFTAISKLDNDEIEIIRELFYNDKTERYLAKKYGVSQVAIHKRKQRILEKLNISLNICAIFNPLVMTTRLLNLLK